MGDEKVFAKNDFLLMVQKIVARGRMNKITVQQQQPFFGLSCAGGAHCFAQSLIWKHYEIIETCGAVQATLSLATSFIIYSVYVDNLSSFTKFFFNPFMEEIDVLQFFKFQHIQKLMKKTVFGNNLDYTSKGT